MSSVSGNLKANKLTLQGHGAVGSDLVMNVSGDTFVMSMSNIPLMTVAPDYAASLDGDVSDTLITLEKNVHMQGTLEVSGAITADSTVAITGALSAASATIGGAATVASVAATGAVTAASVAATGALSAASAAISGAITASSVTTTGAITAKQLLQTSQFATPASGVRSQILMPGKDYKNTNYQTATDGLGNALPFFKTLTQGQSANVEVQLPPFGAFNIEAPQNGATAYQQAFQGVCDQNYVYMTWEPFVTGNNYWTGTDLSVWQSLLGPATDWPNTRCLILKIDRSTGHVANVTNIGLMMDQAYLAAGSTKAAQEAAIGPGPYVADASGNPLKDSSNNYVTQAVNGVDRTATGYAGFQTVNMGATWAQCGDDAARGPLNIYYDTVLGVNCLYMCSMAQKYASVYKIRADTMALVWRRTIDPFFVSHENPELTNGGLSMRQVMVIPPGFGRSHPVVVTGATDNYSYSTDDIKDIGKIFDMFFTGGAVQAWMDYGATAGTASNSNTNTPMWQTLVGPKPLKVGDALPLTVFRQAAPGSAMLTINGVTETQDSSGFILDEDGNASIEVRTPLVNGYVFRDGNPAGTTAADCKTTGTFTLLTGHTFQSLTSPINPYLKLAGVAIMSESAPFMMQEYEIARFTFTAGTFDASSSYTGTIQNGPNVGQSISVLGQALLNGCPDSNGRLFPTQNYGNGLFQPVVKKIYKAQAGRALDHYETSELSIFAGGIYLNLAYDVETDVIICPTGQHINGCAGIEKLTSKLLLSNVVCNGVSYPGVNESFSVTDASGATITNKYVDASGVPHVDTSFHPGRNFFRGIDSSGVFQPIVYYDMDLALNNPMTNFVKNAITNYYFTYSASFNCAGLSDASGNQLVPITSNFWIPGADASGNVSNYAQSVFLNDRHNAFWKKVAMIRDNQNLGPYFNRQGACGVSGFRVSNGELMFSANFHGYDKAEHSYDILDLPGGHVLGGMFTNCGHNADGCSATIVNVLKNTSAVASYDSSGFGLDAAGFRVDAGGFYVDSSGFRRKLLVCTSKSRLHVLDFKKLVDASGNSKTLTHVPGDSTLDYQLGLQTNTWRDAQLYEDLFGFCHLTATFNGYATNANNGGNDFLVTRGQSYNTNFTVFLPMSNVPNKEVHGDHISQYAANVWSGAPALSDTALASRISTAFGNLTSEDRARALCGQTLVSDPSGNWNKVLLAGAGQLVASMTGRGHVMHTNYNIEKILRNAITNPALNTPANAVKYQYNCYDAVGVGSDNAGPQVYGNVVLSGTNIGNLEVFNLATGYPINQPNPLPGQYVPRYSNSAIGIYNAEGQRVPPVIVDGVMYGYGGANKWVRPGTTGLAANPSKLFMWTPYGK